jgi:hypothetical protein
MEPISKEVIYERIQKLSQEDLIFLNEMIDFVYYKKMNSLSTSKDILMKIINSKGYSNFEDLVLKIKNVPFNRSSFDYIIGSDLSYWLKINLDCTEEQSRTLIQILVKSGLLKDSGLGNYK